MANVDLILDIGTKTGRLLAVCADVIKRGIGLDLSRQMLQVARSNIEAAGSKNCTIRHGDMYRLPIETGVVEAVIIHQVLHHADEPRLVLQEAARVLVPQGLLILVDFAPHQMERLRNDHQHRRLGFFKSEIEHWFSGAGLDMASDSVFQGSELTVHVWSGHKKQA